jgi:DNA repair photolyase
MGLDVGEDFASRLFAKVNVANVLRQELGRKSWQRQPVAIGTATDPYQGIEGLYRLTRGCLQALADFHTPGNVTTKGTLVVRDVDVLQQLHRSAGAGISVSLITLDEEIWRALEPGTPPPRQRLRALERLSSAGIRCGLALAPVLPGLTDSPPALRDVVRAAADHGAQWLWSGTVHFEPAVRDWFLAELARHFPSAIPPYVRVYGPAGSLRGARYAPSAYANRIKHEVTELKTRYGLAERHRPAPQSLPDFTADRRSEVAAGSNLPGFPAAVHGAKATWQLALPI